MCFILCSRLHLPGHVWSLQAHLLGEEERRLIEAIADKKNYVSYYNFTLTTKTIPIKSHVLVYLIFFIKIIQIICVLSLSHQNS